MWAMASVGEILGISTVSGRLMHRNNPWVTAKFQPASSSP
jgi:hypothetical protein